MRRGNVNLSLSRGFRGVTCGHRLQAMLVLRTLPQRWHVQRCLLRYAMSLLPVCPQNLGLPALQHVSPRILKNAINNEVSK